MIYDEIGLIKKRLKSIISTLLGIVKQAYEAILLKVKDLRKV
jgi:hypothetical protein